MHPDRDWTFAHDLGKQVAGNGDALESEIPSLAAMRATSWTQRTRMFQVQTIIALSTEERYTRRRVMSLFPTRHWRPLAETSPITI